MRKTLFYIISLLAVLSMLIAGCAPAATQAPEVTQAPAATIAPTAAGPVTIRIFTNQTTSMDLPNSTLTTYFQDKFNIKFDWDITTTDCGSALEKRNLEIASGDYAELMFLTDYCDKIPQTDLIKFGQQGVFLPLNDLIDQYAPDIKAAMDKYPNYKSMITAPDGKIYGLVGYSEGCYHCFYPQKMWINTAWLEKLNLQMPKTTDEFKAVLEAFKTKDPNGNGQADENSFDRWDWTGQPNNDVDECLHL